MTILTIVQVVGVKMSRKAGIALVMKHSASIQQDIANMIKCCKIK